MKFVEKYKNRAVELLIEILKVGEVYNDFWTFTQLFGANFLYYPDIDSIVTDNANEQTHSENFSLIDGHLKKNDLIDNFILVSNNDIGDNYKWHVFWSPFVYSLGRYFDTEKLHIPYNENYKKELENKIKTGYYICYNGVTKYARMVLLNELKRYGVEKKGVISLLGVGESNKHLHEYEKEFFENFDFIPDSSVLDIPNSYPRGSGGAATYYFNKSHFEQNYFSIITESFPRGDYSDSSNINEEGARCLTEKTIKALAVSPFIINAECGSLSVLKKLGFETFPEWFDESYDEIPMSIEKVMFIAEQINKICSLPLKEVHELYVKTLPKVIHNQHKMIDYYKENKNRVFSDTNKLPHSAGIYRFGDCWLEINHVPTGEHHENGSYYLDGELIAQTIKGKLI
jgi:hypothetical protein